MKHKTCRERIRWELESAMLVAFFGGVYIVEWARKRARGDKSPIVVFPFVRTGGGARGW